jgi:adenylate cyclase
VPHNTGTQPDWAFTLGFIVNTIAARVLVVATVWYAIREIARAERTMETEYQRSESLLANILPVSVAERLKNPAQQHHCRQVRRRLDPVRRHRRLHEAGERPHAD